MPNESVGNTPRKVHVGPGSWSLLLFCLNWLGMSKDRSDRKRRAERTHCHVYVSPYYLKKVTDKYISTFFHLAEEVMFTMFNLLTKKWVKLPRFSPTYQAVDFILKYSTENRCDHTGSPITANNQTAGGVVL